MTNKDDNIYSKVLSNVNAFKFDQRVANVFTDMISRSVPGYAQILDLLPTLTRQFQFPKHVYYDLGCSLGAGMVAMAEGLRDIDCDIVGVDNSTAMLAKASPVLTQHFSNITPRYHLYDDDLNNIELKPSGMVLMNFTLQFIPLNMRQALIEKIFASLAEGGAFILSEKINFSDDTTNSVLTDIHHQFKADQGYSQLEISQKRDAIENVLIPEPLESHINRLKEAGFSVVTPWIQNLQFISILAIK